MTRFKQLALAALLLGGSASAQASTQWQYGFLTEQSFGNATELRWTSLSGSKAAYSGADELFEALGCSREGITQEIDYSDFLLWTCLGRNGWEYTETMNDGGNLTHIFKRPAR